MCTMVMVVTRPRSDVTAIYWRNDTLALYEVVTRPRSDVTAISEVSLTE